MLLHLTFYMVVKEVIRRVSRGRAEKFKFHLEPSCAGISEAGGVESDGHLVGTWCFGCQYVEAALESA